jgi:hypothetical protein
MVWGMAETAAFMGQPFVKKMAQTDAVGLNHSKTSAADSLRWVWPSRW